MANEQGADGRVMGTESREADAKLAMLIEAIEAQHDALTELTNVIERQSKLIVSILMTLPPAPNSDPASSSFGIVTKAQQNSPRVVQMALKLYF